MALRKKSIHHLLAQADNTESSLKRTLGMGNLIALGIGGIIGAGLFVRTAAAAAEAAGPGVTISFVIAALGCALAGLCYAEFASMIPIAGSAYAYSYVTMGELIAWIIGWALVLEYALGAVTVSVAWSEYLNQLLMQLHLVQGGIPYEWCHSPFETLHNVTGQANIAQIAAFNPDFIIGVKNEQLILTAQQASTLPTQLAHLVAVHRGIVNAPAFFIILAITLILIRGTKESAFVNAIIVFIKVAIVIAFIAIGWHFINPANHTPYTIPANELGHEAFNRHGWGGIIGGAAIVFFAFIGFDAVSTAAQEAKNPKRDMPIGILGSLVVCTVLYVLFSYVLTGIAPWREFKTAGKEASVTYAITHYMIGYEWLSVFITIAILAGFSSVILVMLLGQSRVTYSMSNDGLIPKVFAAVHPKFRTPYKSNLILFCFAGVLAAFMPGSIAGDLTSFGTLFAFTLVCVGVWIMRKTNPEIPRGFKTPLVPFIPILGVIVCVSLIVTLDKNTLLLALIWLAFGLVVYLLYGRRHSHLNTPSDILPKAKDFEA